MGEPKLKDDSALFKLDRRAMGENSKEDERRNKEDDRRRFLRPTRELRSRGLLVALVMGLAMIFACYLFWK
jgi:hypothetical protein